MTSTTLRLSNNSKVTFNEFGSGEPILLIHGVGLCADSWSLQIAELSKNFHTIAVNMPGHGGSDLLEDGARLPDYVDWTVKVIQSLGLGSVALVGHSMGALIAIGLAVEHSSLVDKVVLLNAVNDRSPTARKAVISRANEIALGSGDINQTLNRWFGEKQTEIRNQVFGWLSSVNQTGYSAAYLAFSEGDNVYSKLWHRVKCPVLVLTGDKDYNSTPAMAKNMAQAASLGELVIIKGHGHLVNMTAPDLVNRSIANFLAREKLLVS